jgi:glycosyltransferase involved in cell wall biosynthesis
MLGPGVEIAKRLSIRTIFSAAVDGDVNPRTALFRKPYCWPLYAWGLRQSDKIFVQHDGQLAVLSTALRSKASILPAIAVAVSKAINHFERDRYVAWVAMFREPKCPHLLIDIARRLPGIRFVVCGAPTTFCAPKGYGEQMVHQLRNLPNVQYRGQVAPREEREIIGNAAVFLSTSVMEGLPNTFLEAWSAGTPVISIQCDPGRIIERFGLGTVTLSFDRTLEEIAGFIESPQRRELIANRVQDYIVKYHNEAAAVAAFEDGIRTTK